MSTVRVTVSGGVVQHVAVPEGVAVIVRDFDVEGIDTQLLQQDERRDHYIESIWTAERNANAGFQD